MTERLHFRPVLNDPQAEFFTLKEKFRLFVSGYGAGKTWVGCCGIFRHAWEWPGIDAGYFAPTYPQIRDIFYPTVEEAAEHWGLQVEVLTSKNEVRLFDRGTLRCRVICRSMDDPGKIVGFKIGHALVDEIDLLPVYKAQTAWRKIIGRMRYNVTGLRNGVDVATTPEGFGFAYQTFVKALRDKPELSSLYGMVQASTYDNEANLPSDYIDSLRASYPPQLVEAYLHGQFVNLTSGAVYKNFSRAQNHSDAQIDKAEPIHVGMDFNVTNMTAVVTVTREGAPHAVAEVTGVRDTPTMARMLVERFGRTGDGGKRQIVVYPDASGGNTSSKDASESDLSILRQAGLSIRVKNSNPSVKDRVNSVNALILNSKGDRRLFVNTLSCPVLTEALEQQAYDKNGEPDKKTGHDHPNDAIGYRVMADWAIPNRTSSVTPLQI